MDIKILFGLSFFPLAIFIGSAAAAASRKLRDAILFLLVLTSPLIDRLDINYVSRDWYRGTSRGFQLSIPDVLAISLLVGCLLIPARGKPRLYWPPSLGFMGFFFLYACFNVAISDPRLYGLFELLKMVNGFIVFLAVALYLRSDRELRVLLTALACVVCLEGLLALKQRYLDGYHRVPGTVGDPNSLSVFFCLTAPVLVAGLNAALPKLLKVICAGGIALACVGQVLSISRAGIVTLILVLLGCTAATLSYTVTARKIVWSCIILVGAAGVAAKSWETLKERYEETSLAAEYKQRHNMGRGYYIRLANAIVSEQPLGVGLNCWSYWVSNLYGPRMGYKFVPYHGTDVVPSNMVPPGSNVDEAQAAPAHSLPALTLGELGIPGFILFAFLWLRWFQMGASFLFKRTPDPMRRLGVGFFFGLCGMFLQSQTEWVFRQPSLYYMSHVLLGALASLYCLKRQQRRRQLAAIPTQSSIASWQAAAAPGH